MATHKVAFLLQFKDDTLSTVSRASVKTMAKKMGFNDTQVVHYALARLREQVLPSAAQGSSEVGEYPPLTKKELAIIDKHAPKRRGKPLTSESLF